VEDQLSLKLIPLIDMVNHDDGVEPSIHVSDGVFTPRDSMTMVADRGYHSGEQIYCSYGRLTAADKLFSFGYVEIGGGPDPPSPPSTTTSSSTATTSSITSSTMPSQGTAIFGCHLDTNDKLYEWKVSILRSVGMGEEGEVIDVGVRFARSQEGGEEKKADVVIEPEEGLGRLQQYMRLVVANQEWWKEQTGSTSEEALQMVWGRCRDPLDAINESSMGIKIISMCQFHMERVNKQLDCLQAKVIAANGVSGGGDKIVRRRDNMILTYLHGELLAWRAIAEFHMEMVESLLGGGDDDYDGDSSSCSNSDGDDEDWRSGEG